MELSVIKSKSCERERNSVSVPCKLNNVKTNYNTLDILKCLSLNRVNEFKPTKILEYIC